MTLLARHMAKLEAAEDLERAVYRAGLAWYEPARKAAEAKGRMVQAAQKLAAAESAIRSILQGFEGIDREFGADLWRLYNSGQLTRENIGEGGGRRIKDLLTAESGLGKAREEATRTQQRSSDANAKANGLYGDVIRALDAFRQSVTLEVYEGVEKVFNVQNGANPDTIADSCKTRLQVLGEKA